MAHSLWLARDWYGLIWPNLAASAVCAAAVYLKLRAEQIAHREELKRHVSRTVSGEVRHDHRRM